VERATKDGRRTIDTRAAIVALTWADPGVPGSDAPAGPTSAEPGATGLCAIMHMVVRHTTPAVRPDDVVAALRAHAGLSTPEPARVTRMAQGRLPAQGTDGRAAHQIELHDPLAADLAAARS